MFIDTAGFNSPCILIVSQDDLDRSRRGFKIRGNRYRGVVELIEDIAFHLETGMWNTSKALYETKGVHKLQLQYGTR